MNYKIVNINTALPQPPIANLLIIYTGGTLGMEKDADGSLSPFNFGKIFEKLPDIRNYNLKLTVISFPKPIDSSDVSPTHWQDIGYIIDENYEQYDGFVVIHGTDTMAYSASALSFMLDGLNKPVIFTGSQLPIGVMRSDARENFLTSLEMASAKDENGNPIVAEVCILFNSILIRGNRSKKIRSSQFGAFKSENYPKLAEAGITIEFNRNALQEYSPNKKLNFKNKFDRSVAVMPLFPGMTEEYVKAITSMKGLRGIVMQSYGSGNATTRKWFVNALQEALDKGIIIYNVSQCIGGRVIQGRYATSKRLQEMGVISGDDITLEAAVTKLMFLLGSLSDTNEVKRHLKQNIAGEITLATT
ncbi:asparaginase [Marinigracilibium pacificum]|uniref:asparaginase n=1 Tax=Marinigracilibium pacificum TaxID=2729599 RepID=A0A848J1L6_9BACT|nr:asparaginase [Marinigracilibium pacificum]NMM50713.1 asparaginase [Marinigracilibium pacificum]